MLHRQVGIDKWLLPEVTPLFVRSVAGYVRRSPVSSTSYGAGSTEQSYAFGTSDQCRQSPRNAFTGHDRRGGRGDALFHPSGKTAATLLAPLLLLVNSPPVSAADLALPDNLAVQARILRVERGGYWEKSLVVSFPSARRTLSTSDGMLDASAVLNHSADPLLWEKMGHAFKNQGGDGGKIYAVHVREQLAQGLGVDPSQIAGMSTAADMDNLAVVTREFGPLTVSVLATAGVKSNAIRTGVDEGRYIEGADGEAYPQGTINILVLTNVRLTEGAMARAIVTVTEGKTAALEDLKVPSTYTPTVQATGTGTDSVIVVSGTGEPQASYTGGHSRLGELIGKATYEAVLESLGKQNGFFLPAGK